jgi:hypothetical protein
MPSNPLSSGQAGDDRAEETPKEKRDRIERKDREEKEEEQFDKQGLPIGEPPTEGKYSI